MVAYIVFNKSSKINTESIRRKQVITEVSINGVNIKKRVVNTKMQMYMGCNDDDDEICWKL